MSERSPPMSISPPEATAAVRCAYPGCENEPRAAEDGAGAKPKYCERPDALTGKPHSALTAFRRRQELARQGGAAEPEDLGRPVTMATERAAQLRKEVQDGIAALTRKLTNLVAQLDRAAEPEAAAAQVETVQAEAPAARRRPSRRRPRGRAQASGRSRRRGGTQRGGGDGRETPSCRCRTRASRAARR